MTEPERPPRTPDRAEGEPPGDEPDAGRTPHSEEPAEGGTTGDGNADSPDV